MHPPQLVENLHEGVWVIDKDAYTTFVNLRMAEMLGYTVDEMQGRHLFSFMDERGVEISTRNLERREQGIEEQHEFEFLRKDGTRVYTLMETGSITDDDGNYIGAIAGVQDITERKRAEEALRESERKYRAIIESSHEVIFSKDLDGRYCSLNLRAAIGLGGTCIKDVEGKTDYELLPKEQADALRKVDEQVMKSGRATEVEELVRDAQGENRIYLSHKRPLYDDKGRIDGISCFAMDITEHKRLEEQLRQAQKMEAIGTLAGGVAHDFNNMLMAIQGNTELALMHVRDDGPLVRNLNEIRKASTRAANLTRQLLLFSRRQPMEMTPLHLNGVMDDLTKMLNRLIGEDVSLTTELASDLRTVEGDVGTIEQVIMNLVVNARDAMPKGGAITIQTQNVEVDEEYCETYGDARPGKFVCLAIQDTGVGMDQAIMDRIFEPFFTTKERGKGTGLGLSVVYGIIKQHEGWITVESAPGKGALFKAYLPAISRRPEEQEGEKAHVSLEAFRARGERILMVEDDESLRNLAEEVLSENGYVVFTAANAQEALERFEKEAGNFDLLFSDVVLPDGKGPELLKRLLQVKPGLIVLFTSGYPPEKSDWQVIRERAYPYLQKPYPPSDLLRRVSDVLKKKYIAP